MMEEKINTSKSSIIFFCFFLAVIADAFAPSDYGKIKLALDRAHSRTRINGRPIPSSSPTRQANKVVDKSLDRDYSLLCLNAESRSGDNFEDDDDDTDDIKLGDEDWRAFRAKLVMGEKTASGEIDAKLSSDSRMGRSDDIDTSALTDERIDRVGSEYQSSDESDLDGIGSIFQDNFADTSPIETALGERTNELTLLDPSQWAYDSGDVIEQGAVILGGIEQEFGFGLRQQYFHKTVILVVDHTPTFTKGIILNRPTDLTLEDDINPGLKWRVWFGGDVEGIHAQNPDILCLHSLNDDRATKASIPVMKDIQWTTFDNAKVRNWKRNQER